jgi:DNA-binding response OmpR family regulator
VLFVEDEESLRLPVSWMLRKRNFSVIEAGDGRAAFDLLHSHKDKIDVLLLDWTLPGTAPDELVKEARRIRPDTKIVLTSAYNRQMVMNGIESTQIQAFIRKPFQLDDLVQLLRDVLTSQGQRALGHAT